MGSVEEEIGRATVTEDQEHVHAPKPVVQGEAVVYTRAKVARLVDGLGDATLRGRIVGDGGEPEQHTDVGDDYYVIVNGALGLRLAKVTIPDELSPGFLDLGDASEEGVGILIVSDLLGEILEHGP